MTWVQTNPDFTFCFKNTVLVWAPCLFLAIFTPLDLYRRSNSRYSDIPWSFLNITKFLSIFLLICLTFADLAMILSVRADEAVSTVIHDIQIWSVSIKAGTFVSTRSMSQSQHFRDLKSERERAGSVK